MPLAMTILVSCLATVATIAMLSRAVANYNPGSWETVVILGGWDVLVYGGLVLLALALRYSRHGSWVIVTGAALISGFSIAVLYADLAPYLTPPTPASRTANCFGPLIQLGLPILQWGGFVVVAVLAGYAARRRCTPPVGN